MHIFVITGKQFTCTAYSSLNLIGNKQHIVLMAKVIAFFQIPIIRNKCACFTLDRFYQKAGNILILIKYFFKGIDIIERNYDKTRSIRTVVVIGVVIDRE